MGILAKKEYTIKNISEDTQRVPTLEGKKEVKSGKEFVCSKRDGDNLLRLYKHLFTLIDEGNTEIKVPTYTKNNVGEVETDETTGADETVKTDEADAKDNNDNETSDLDNLRKEYKEKLGNDVPVNKKNDMEWIKLKLNTL